MLHTHTRRERVSSGYITCNAEVRKTHIQYKTLWECFDSQEGGRAGDVLPPAQKTKKNEVKNSFPIAEVCVCGKTSKCLHTAK